MRKKRCPKSAKKNGHAALEPDPPDGLTPQQGVAVEALAEGQSTSQAAAAAGVNPRTVRRWAKEPAFHSALSELRREPVGQAVGIAQRYAPAAVGALLKVLNNPAAPTSSTVAASTAVLRFAVDGLELLDLARRIEELERLGAGHGAAVPRPGTPPPGNGSSKRPEGDEP